VRPDAKDASRAFWRAFRAISNTRVDWVIARDMEVIAVIELDDRTHDPRKDARRDRILASCGYKVLRFESHRRPDPRQIREAVLRHPSAFRP
jgi:very-short-patch-repair endonuclease